MAQATVMSYSKFVIKLGDGNSPETFDAPCGLNTRSLTRTKNVSEIDIPDCTDEDAPAWVGREVKSLDWSVAGEGVLSAEAFQMWEDAFDSIESRNVMIEYLWADSPPGSVTKVGRAHLTSLVQTGNRGEKVTVSIEMQGDGALVQTVPV